MTMLTKKKRRSGHGFFSSTSALISSPISFVKVSSTGDRLPIMGNSAVDNSTHDIGRIVSEPLVQDLDQVHADEEHAPVHYYPRVQAPLEKTPDYHPLGSHPVPTPSPSAEDDAAADPPPDFTRRGIHIPTRTR